MQRGTGRSAGPPVVDFLTVTIFFAVNSFAMLQGIVVPALPTLAEHLHTSASSVTWVFTAYLLSASVATPVLGRLGDLYGSRNTFVGVLAALALGCLIAALASNLPTMIAARVLQGAGGGALPLAFGIIRRRYPSGQVAARVSVIAAVAAGGAGLGTAVSGPILEYLGYQWLFLVPMILTVSAAAAFVFVLPRDQPETAVRPNAVAAVFLAAWLVAVLLVISEGTRWGWTSAPVVCLLVAGLCTAGAWWVAELRSSVPLVDVRMLAQRSMLAANLVALLLGAAMFGNNLIIQVLLQSPGTSYGFGLTITHASLIVLPQQVLIFLVGLVCGAVARRIGYRILLVAGGLANSLGIGLTVVFQDNLPAVCAGTVVCGVGLGFGFTGLAAMVVALVPPHQTGVASAANANVRNVGGAVGTSLASGILAASAGNGIATGSGITTSLIAFACAAAASGLAGLLLPGGPLEPALAREPVVAVAPELALLPSAPLAQELD